LWTSPLREVEFGTILILVKLTALLVVY